MGDLVKIALRKNPFALGHVDHELPEGISVTQMIEAVGLKDVAAAHGGIHVFVGDEMVDRTRWDDVRLVRGSIVSVALAPGGGGGSGGKDPARTVAMIAVMVVAIVATYGTTAYLAPAMGITGAGASALGAFAGAAVSLAGSMLVNALIPLPEPKNKSDDGRNYLSGMSNTMDPYGPIPRIFGRHRVFPRYAAVPYTELVGTDEQYLRVLFCVGKGLYELSDFKIGETAIEDFDDVEMEIYHSGSSTHYALYPNDISETALTIELEPSTAQTRTTGENVDEIAVEVTFPEGLYRIGSDGDRKSTTVAIKCEYSIKDAGVWREFTSFERLHLTPYETDPIAVGDTVVGPSGSGIVRYVHTNGATVQTGTDTDGNPIYLPISYTDYITVEVTTGWFFAADTITIDSTYTATVTTTANASGSITGEYGTPVKKSFSVKVPRGQYDVRVTRVTADETDRVRTTYWTTLRTITYSSPFPFAGCMLIGLRIRATGQLNGMLDQFNCIAHAFANVWDGTGWNYVKTRNPAWAMVEVLIGNSNKRPILNTRLNTTALRNFALRCTAAGFHFDAVVDYKTTVWELLRQICAVGRASPGLTDNFYTVVEDITQTTPVQHFSPRNSWNYSGSRSFPDVPHALRIRFKNSANDWQDDECIVYDDGFTSETATLYETLEFFGVTTYNHAWKLGRYHLACLRLRPETHTFDVDIEHMVCTRGDLVLRTDDAILIGLGQARIKTISTTTISIDDVFVHETAKTYGFQFRRADGTFTTATITTHVGENIPGYVFTISPAMSAGDLPAVGDLCFYGETGAISIDLLVSRIDPGPDLSARLTCIPYDALILSADSGTIPEWESDITLPPIVQRTPPKPKIISATIAYRAAAVNTYGTQELVMSVGFDAQATAFSASGSNYGPGYQPTDVVQGFQAEYQEDAGNWITLTNIGANERKFEFPAKNETAYIIRLRSYSTPGNFSAWDTYTYGTTDFDDALPANVSGLALAAGSTWNTKDLEVTWTAVPGGGTGGAVLKDYKVEVLTSDGLTSLRTEYVTQNKYTYTFDKNIADGGPRASIRIKVQARNMFGLLSETPADVTFSNVAPINPQGLGTRAFMGGVEFYWDPATNFTTTEQTVEGQDDAAITGQDTEAITGEDYVEGAVIDSDFSHFLYSVKVGTGEWSAYSKTIQNGLYYVLSADERTLYGTDATIYIRIKSVDMFGQESASSEIDEDAGNLNIHETDIDNFAIGASKIFNKIPVIQGLELTNDSPSAGSIFWSSCTVCYNGAAYLVSSGSTDKKYVYWKDLDTRFIGTDTHPATLSDWTPGEDFIIAVNIDGVGQEAWNAIANQVIGSAYIMDAAIDDAKVSTLSGTKISATSSIAIGSATWENAGIQLEYNNGNPRFYAGDGAYDYIKFVDGDGIEINSGGAAGVVKISGGIISVNSGVWADQGIQLDYNDGVPRFNVGDGGDNYIRFNGTRVVISSDLPNAVEIKNGGNIKITAGGNIDWYDAGGNQIFKIHSNATNLVYLQPAADATKTLKIGDSSTYRWNNIFLYAATQIAGLAYNESDTYKYAGWECMPGDSRFRLGIGYRDGSNNAQAAYINFDNLSASQPAFYPTVNNDINVGRSAYAFETIFAYTFTDVGDYFHLDSRDDISLLKQIKGSGVIDARTGLELIDDSTLPEILLYKNVNGKSEYNESDDNKPYISHKALFSLLMGAARQLDDKIIAITTRLTNIEKKLGAA